jgi:hypothetical protein
MIITAAWITGLSLGFGVARSRTDALPGHVLVLVEPPEMMLPGRSQPISPAVPPRLEVRPVGPALGVLVEVAGVRARLAAGRPVAGAVED